MAGMPKKASAPKTMNDDPCGNSPVAWVMPPKNPPAQIVKNSCSGNWVSKVIQPMKIGRTVNTAAFIAMVAWSGLRSVANQTRQGRYHNAAARLLHQHHHRVLDQRLERADQDCAERAIHRAMIARHGHAHDVGGFDLAVAYHGALLAGADGEDGRLRRIDHRGEILDAVHAEVRHRGGAALVFVRLEFSRT